MVKNSKNFSKEMRVIALLINANIQVVLIIWLCFNGLGFLHKKYPVFEYWDYLIAPFAIILCVITLYRLVVELVRLEKNGRNNAGDEH